MSEEEKEIKIISFIYTILTDKSNQNRYCSTMYGNIEEGKIIRLNDCIEYLEKKYKELVTNE